MLSRMPALLYSLVLMLTAAFAIRISMPLGSSVPKIEISLGEKSASDPEMYVGFNYASFNEIVPVFVPSFVTPPAADKLKLSASIRPSTSAVSGGPVAAAARRTINAWVDPLPIPERIIVPKDQTDLTMHLTQFTSRLHRDFPNEATMWGYNGSSPGPVIEVERGQKLRIHWQNDLPKNHILASPKGAMAMGPMRGDRVVFDGPRTDAAEGMNTYGLSTIYHAIVGFFSSGMPDVRNVTHMHGAKVEERDPLNFHYNSDGWPDAWTVPGEEQVAEYENDQDARTLFYHDHAIGETGRNVAAGLLGPYVIHDDLERSLNLPSGKYEIPLILSAVGVTSEGTRFYTNRIDSEFFGNGILVNGKYLPYLAVEPRKYRFRIVNAQNSRTVGLGMVDVTDGKSPGPAFYQIGSDAGFLANTVVMSDYADPDSPRLFLMPAERADVIVDFSKYAGRNFILTNSGVRSDPDGELPLPQIMAFKVGTEVTEPDTSSIPTDIRPLERLDPAGAVITRHIELSQTMMAGGKLLFQIDRRMWDYQKSDAKGNYWDYQIEHKVQAGTTEVWEIVNTSVQDHPFHVHLADFQVLDRRPFDVGQYEKTGQLVYTDDAIPPRPNEWGWKDVVPAISGYVTRIVMHFGPTAGYYVYHCHMLEHEDMDMMVPFQVVPAPVSNLASPQAPH